MLILAPRFEFQAARKDMVALTVQARGLKQRSQALQFRLEEVRAVETNQTMS
jgi:hypothetical protein